MPLWPAALFALVLGLLATVQVARGDHEILAGTILSVVLAALVGLWSPLFLVPLGVLVVVLGWKRGGKTLGRRVSRKARRHEPPRLPVLIDSLRTGAREAAAPYKRANQTQEDADALVLRAHSQNPFRPEGASGLLPLNIDERDR